MPQASLQNRHLDWLEAESIYIIREVVAECRNPALLFSGGKDSVVLLALARARLFISQGATLRCLFRWCISTPATTTRK